MKKVYFEKPSIQSNRCLHKVFEYFVLPKLHVFGKLDEIIKHEQN